MNHPNRNFYRNSTCYQMQFLTQLYQATAEALSAPSIIRMTAGATPLSAGMKRDKHGKTASRKTTRLTNVSTIKSELRLFEAEGRGFAARHFRMPYRHKTL